MTKKEFTSADLSRIWGKTNQETKAWHPVMLHMIDVAAVADVLLDRFAPALRNKFTKMLGFDDWSQARPWILWLVASHDIGKISPGFQSKWEFLFDQDVGLTIPRGGADSSVNHGFVSQAALQDYFIELLGRRPRIFIRRICAAVGAHHGFRAKASELNKTDLERASGDASWAGARRDALKILAHVLGAHGAPKAMAIDGPQYMLLAGLTSFADWIGSNVSWFAYGQASDCDDLEAWFKGSQSKAAAALDFIGINPHRALQPSYLGFDGVFGFKPRPLQQTVEQVVGSITSPSVMLLEAPMGEGKTEAALYAFLDLQRRLGHRGMYMAMPSMATGNAMFDRALGFLRGFCTEQSGRSLMLAHSASILNDAYDAIKISGIEGDEPSPDVYVTDWFANRNRALLTDSGVGTVDQALTAVLPIRHQHVRMWGLANKVVIIDEVHAYDEYTAGLIFFLVSWLLGLGSSVILLSATLPSKFRRRLSEVVGAVRTPELDAATYPRLTVYEPGKNVAVHTFADDPTRKKVVTIERCGASIGEIKSCVDGLCVDGASVCALLNTVNRTQALYDALGEGRPIVVDGVTVGKALPCGLRVHLFHAGFMAKERRVREDVVLKEYGKGSDRSGRKLLIATQVVEQSLDVDFDAMLSDIAPLDLLLQRLGRLWRHLLEMRAFSVPKMVVAGLGGDELANFKLSQASFVYQEYYLARTWYILRDKYAINLPMDIDKLVEMTYDDTELAWLSSDQQRDLRAMKIAMDGGELAKSQAVFRSSIGSPKDSSWEDVQDRFFDVDDGGVHHSLVAKTRLGRESVSIIPVFHGESADLLLETLGFKNLAGRMLSLSRPSVVRQLKAKPVSQRWAAAPVVGRCIPVEFSRDGVAVGVDGVRYDSQLGVSFF